MSSNCSGCENTCTCTSCTNQCSECTCKDQPCACEFDLSSACIRVERDFECIGSTKGQTVEQNLEKIDNILCNLSTSEDGDDGDSAYQIWLNLGNVGTEQDFIDSLKPYGFIYPAIINQEGIDAPTVSVSTINTIGSVVWSRSGVGDYVGTLSGAFSTGLVNCQATQGAPAATTPGIIQISRLTDDTIGIKTFNSSGVAADDILKDTSIKIEIYPL